MIDLEAIKARLTAAIPGPWYVDESLRGVEAHTYGYPVEVVAWTGRAEAVLIAHAPADIGALVAEVVTLRAENNKLRDVLGWVETQCPGKCAGVCFDALSGEHRREGDE